MKIEIEPYHASIQNLPAEGQHIVAHQAGNEIVVYQAYKNSIANFAVKHQQLGGSEFSYNRMSWIKPNFLWMMFRCGWAEKENQERVLALWMDKKDFDTLLREAVLSTYDSHYYQSHDNWKAELATKEVRLQWDPDHNPHGNKITRRALQLGIKGKMLEEFGKKDIRLIEDVTEFVKEGGAVVKANQLDKLMVPMERVYKPADAELCKRIDVNLD